MDSIWVFLKALSDTLTSHSIQGEYSVVCSINIIAYLTLLSDYFVEILRSLENLYLRRIVLGSSQIKSPLSEYYKCIVFYFF